MIQQALFDTGLTVYSVFIGSPVELRNMNDRRRAAQLALLSALLESRDGRASTDDIVRDSNATYDDGGKWLGGAVRELSDDGLIQRCDADRSKRPARHGGLLSIWEIIDRVAVAKRIGQLRASLSFTSEATPSTAIDGAAKSDTTHTTSTGSLSDES